MNLDMEDEQKAEGGALNRTFSSPLDFLLPENLKGASISAQRTQSTLSFTKPKRVPTLQNDHCSHKSMAKFLCNVQKEVFFCLCVDVYRFFFFSVTRLVISSLCYIS